jgi:molybdopterin synthase sulfur carrier subunit
MNLNIKYFGLLAEVTGCNEEILEFSELTISELLSELYKKYPHLNDKDFQVAQNHEIVSKDTLVSGEQIALLPPFSGG